jgi:hypothetical protein
MYPTGATRTPHVILLDLMVIMAKSITYEAPSNFLLQSTPVAGCSLKQVLTVIAFFYTSSPQNV